MGTPEELEGRWSENRGMQLWEHGAKNQARGNRLGTLWRLEKNPRAPATRKAQEDTADHVLSPQHAGHRADPRKHFQGTRVQGP